MSDGQHWEYFAGYDNDNGNDNDTAQQPIWKDDVADAAPLFTWENRTSVNINDQSTSVLVTSRTLMEPRIP